MQNIQYRKVLKRGVTLLLVFTLLLTALPRRAKAEDVSMKSGEGGVASFLPGTGDKTYFTILATPKEGFVFDYWKATSEGGYNGLFYGSQLTMPYARNSKGSIINVTFEAFFRRIDQPRFGVRVQVSGPDANCGVVSGGKQATDDRTEVTTTITATPNEGYEFLYWTNDKNATYKFYERSMQVTSSVGMNVLYTAHFGEADEARGVFTNVIGIDADGNRVPGLGGTAVGDMVYSKSGVATQQTVLQAIPVTNGYAFSHWEWKRGDAANPTTFTANPLPVTVGNYHDVYTAVFVAESKAPGVFVESGYYRNSVWTTGGGTATGGKLYDPAGGMGQQTTLQAFAVSAGWVFHKWEKSNATGWEDAGYSPTIAVSVTNAHVIYRAVFIEAANASGVVTAVRLVDGTAGEVPGSATGDKAYNESAGAGQQTTLQAFPASNQYTFTHWELTRDGTTTTASSANPYAVKVENHKDVYTAVFIKTPTNPSSTIIPKETGIADGPFLDVWRKRTAPNYSTTHESMAEKAAGAVSESSGRFKGVSPSTGDSAVIAKLQEDLAQKNANKTKDRSALLYLPEDVLVTSEGVLYTTEDIGAGDYSDIANALVAKRFGNLYDYEILQVVRATGLAEEGGRDTTMVWKDTGATEKDRLLLLRVLADGSDSVATPVADENGVLTFTLPAAAASEYMLLRVFLLQDAE